MLDTDFRKQIGGANSPRRKPTTASNSFADAPERHESRLEKDCLQLLLTAEFWLIQNSYNVSMHVRSHLQIQSHRKSRSSRENDLEEAQKVTNPLFFSLFWRSAWWQFVSEHQDSEAKRAVDMSWGLMTSIHLETFQLLHRNVLNMQEKEAKESDLRRNWEVEKIIIFSR